MAIRKSSSSGIPFGVSAGRPADPAYGQLYSNGETARLEIYTQASGWQNIVQETPGVASATGHYYQSDNYGIFTISGTNFVSGAIAYAVGTNGIEYQAQTTTYNSLVQITATFANLSATYEPYDIKVVNPSNLFGMLPDAFYINESPIWSTTAGSLGSVNGGASVSKTVGATDAESNTITYASSDLPSWLSLNTSTGALTGTAPTVSTNTTYSFNITASDGSNAAVSRSFNIPVVAVSVITGGTLASDSTYYYRTFTANGTFAVSGKTLTADYLIIAGGGGGDGGGGGAGGYRYASDQSVSAGSYSIVVGAGGGAPGDGATSANNAATSGGNSSGFGITSAGGGPAGYSAVGSAGGSGGGGGYSSFAGGAGNTPSTNPVQGYSGGNGAGSAGGGGGGAGGAGANANTSTGGIGSNLHSSWLSAISTAMPSAWQTATSSGYIAGGGGGAGQGVSASGGAGGGGNGYAPGGSLGANRGITNTGGGGGGIYQSYPSNAGGSGIVIVRYTKSQTGA